MTPRQRETYERVLHGVSFMRRHGVSIKEAASEVGTTPETVVRYARPALKRVHARWAARAQDRLERPMHLYDPKGSYQTTVASSETATRISKYHHEGVDAFKVTGDESKLRAFAGKYVVDVEGQRHYFLTDPAAIRRLARAGELGFESIY
jgi:hypothetical protein